MKLRSVLAAATCVAMAAGSPGSAPSPPPLLSPRTSPLKTALEVDRRLREIERDERTTNQQLGELRQKIATAHARAVARGRTYVKLSRTGLFGGFGNFDETVAHASRLERLRRAVERDVQLERRLSALQKKQTEHLGSLLQKKQTLLAQQKAFDQARVALLAEQDRDLAYRRAFESHGSFAPTAIYGGGVGPEDPSALDAGFAAFKGRLPFPLPGRAEVRKAKRPSGQGPGLEMLAPKGTAVRAIYPGRVAFADVYPDYGKTVILDHGENYFSVSASLSEIHVRVGDDVQTGARLGSVGPLDEGTGLYLELRKGMDTLDPNEWFGL